MEELSKHLDKIKIPLQFAGSKVYKDECALSFDTPVGLPCLFYLTKFTKKILILGNTYWLVRELNIISWVWEGLRAEILRTD